MMTDRQTSFTVSDAESGEADAQADLADQLERERDARKEERFLLVVLIIVISDAFIFSHIDSWSGPVVIGVIELVALAVLARKWGVQEVAQFLAMFFQRIAEHSKPPAANNPPNPEIEERP
jgi:hypothetical protein